MISKSIKDSSFGHPSPSIGCECLDAGLILKANCRNRGFHRKSKIKEETRTADKDIVKVKHIPDNLDSSN